MAVCALVGAGPFNVECFRARWEAGAFACVVAVDGGFASLEGVGCTPDVAMGDFDSLGYVPRGSRDDAVPSGAEMASGSVSDVAEAASAVPTMKDAATTGMSAAMEVFEYPAHKDESDMELALRLAQERGFDEVEVYGAVGGRLDHTIANLQLLALFSERGLRVTAIDLVEADHATIANVGCETPSASMDAGSVKAAKKAKDATSAIGTALTFLTGPAELTLDPHPGEVVSVFSLSDESHDVTETGLAYPLDHVVLTNRTSRGLSNEFTDLPATVSVGSGTLVVFHPIF